MSEEQITDSQEVKKFIDLFSEKTSSELSAIITGYLGYKPEAVEAALYLSVEKGLISYDLKESLLMQINTSFKLAGNKIKNFSWEKNNAFVRYFSGYQDDEIYDIIENPTSTVIDVFHGLLVTAKERELISDIDFKRYYDDAILALRSDEEIDNSIIADVFGMKNSLDETSEAEIIEAEKEKYWKCPKCKETVGMEYAVCWNCQSSMPEVFEHPDNIAIQKERNINVNSSPVSIGIKLILGGVFVVIIDYFRYYSHSNFLFNHIGAYLFGGLFVVMGIVFIIYGKFYKSEKY